MPRPRTPHDVRRARGQGRDSSIFGKKKQGRGRRLAPFDVVVHLGAGMTAGMTEASVSPWGGDQAVILNPFMPATYILGMIGAPSLGQIASPREGLTMAGPLRGC